MASKLSLYTGALRILKERRLGSLTENREPRRLLDDAWGDGSTSGAVKYCLEMGQWAFATRTVQADYSPSVEPDFGYRYAFDQPDDMVRPTGIYRDEHCLSPLLLYSDERRYWYTDLQTIYVSYVSNGPDYGADLSLWPESFAKLVEAYLAKEIVGNLTQGDSKAQLAERHWEKIKLEARSIDAMNKPTKFTPQGSWGRSRHGGSSRNSLWNGRS
jgi:hypothetical protein